MITREDFRSLGSETLLLNGTDQDNWIEQITLVHEDQAGYGLFEVLDLRPDGSIILVMEMWHIAAKVNKTINQEYRKQMTFHSKDELKSFVEVMRRW